MLTLFVPCFCLSKEFNIVIAKGTLDHLSSLLKAYGCLPSVL